MSSVFVPKLWGLNQDLTRQRWRLPVRVTWSNERSLQKKTCVPKSLEQVFSEGSSKVSSRTGLKTTTFFGVFYKAVASLIQ